MIMEGLRNFLRLLDGKGELINIEKEVDPKFELAAVLEKIQKTVNKAVIFQKVKGYSIPVVSNLLGSYRRVALSLETVEDEVLKQWIKRELKLYPPKMVKDGPCKEVSFTDEKVDLRKLPIVTHHEKDGGPYITAGVVFAKDPEWHTNMSFNRIQFVGKDKLRIRLAPGFHLRMYYDKVERKQKALEIAVCIGNHPHIMWAGDAKLPLGADHLEFAGALRQAPIEVVKCDGVNVDVPAETEIVIEGEILPNVREAEGPFADWEGKYIPVMENHVVKVRAITHKQNPIYQTILSGSVEHLLMFPGVPVSAEVYKAVKEFVPSIIDVACSPFLCIVKIRKESDDQSKLALMVSLGTNPRLIKFAIVVDEDIDIHNPSDIIWAVSERCRPDTAIIIPGIPAYPLDPYHLHYGKIGIDATIPMEAKADFERIRIPGEEKIHLDEYVREMQ
jgi:UbiD family decarboxylase